LESALHERFHGRRLNLVNTRKEFFRVTIHEVQEIVSQMGLDVRLTLAAEAREHYESHVIRTQGEPNENKRR